jgi:hypothetical protein
VVAALVAGLLLCVLLVGRLRRALRLLVPLVCGALHKATCGKEGLLKRACGFSSVVMADVLIAVERMPAMVKRI